VDREEKKTNSKENKASILSKLRIRNNSPKKLKLQGKELLAKIKNKTSTRIIDERTNNESNNRILVLSNNNQSIKNKPQVDKECAKLIKIEE